MGLDSGRRRGAVLIVVLAVLMVLSLLSVTFWSVQNVERQVSRGYLDGVRAKLVARGGVERAAAELFSSVNRAVFTDPAMQYWGSNVAETGTPDWTTPLEQATNPSYAYENEPLQNPADPAVAPMIFTIEGRQVGISGVMATSTHAPNGDVYRLRVTDANSLIHLNDGLDGGPNGNVSRNLKRMLNLLGRVLALGVADAGDRIVDGRPTLGYRSKLELERVLPQADAQKIARFVSTTAWVDPKAVNPVPLSGAVLSGYPVPYNQQISFYRYGRSRAAATAGGDGTSLSGQALRYAPEFASATGSEHAVMALDELNAQWIERTSRAPVNVNLAPREVLTALIAGLKGFFLVERRKQNPGGDYYEFMFYPKGDNSPGGIRGDEIGFLYSTAPFVMPGDGGGVDAGKIADEIVSCRMKQTSPASGIDYAAVWYGGPFRTWRQFHAFCDGLVGKLLVDTRSGLFFDYGTQSAAWEGPATGPDTLLASPIQPKFAAQALADVLKANFNPNVTPNEINPDANLYLIVDKTDLICNSTEFCFTPMGVFEIESEGMLLQTAAQQDFLAVKDARVVARKKIACSLKFYDVMRETTQADFYPGTLSPRSGMSALTNNNRTLEIGPEPDNGPAPGACRWSGWLQLATLGGMGTGAAAHAPGTLERTPDGTSELGSAAHSHFGLDHRLHHHAGGARETIASTSVCRNNRDRTETGAGPYNPTVGPAGRHRLARDWERASPPSGADYVAPSDLRLDGIYVERDSAPMYKLDTNVLDAAGTVAMWVKPSFHPEMTGKPRTWWSLDTLKSGRWPILNSLWFFASQDAPAYATSPREGFKPYYAINPSGKWRPISVVAGYSMWDGIGGGIGSTTDSLNHRSHPAAESSKPNLINHHRWTHVTYAWSMGAPEVRKTHILINGVSQPATDDVWVHKEDTRVKIAPSDFLTPSDNPMRLGEPSATTWFSNQNTSRNWAADVTMDEFYLWKGVQLERGLDLFSQGRYYKPASGYEALYTSPDLTVAPPVVRALPPPGAAAVPSGYASPVPPPAGSTTAPPTTILAVAWTWYADSVAADGKPQLRDWFSETDLKPEVELEFLLNGAVAGGTHTDDGASPVTGLRATPLDQLRYRLRVRLPGATFNTILLETPVIDDVTIYYSTGIEFLTYELLEVSL